MFRGMVLAVLAAGVLTFAVEAQAGIFFRRGGCAGGQCGGYSMPATSTAAAPAQSEAAVQNENDVAQQESAASDSNTTTTAAQSNPIRRVGFRRLGGIRLFGRWR